MINRDASIALAVFTSDTCPTECYLLQQYGDDKLICCYDPEDSDCLAINVAYRLCRIEALRKLRGVSPQLDTMKMRELVQQCFGKLKTIADIKRKVTRLSNEVNSDLDALRTDLELVLEKLDEGIQQAGVSQF